MRRLGVNWRVNASVNLVGRVAAYEHSPEAVGRRSLAERRGGNGDAIHRRFDADTAAADHHTEACWWKASSYAAASAEGSLDPSSAAPSPAAHSHAAAVPEPANHRIRDHAHEEVPSPALKVEQAIPPGHDPRSKCAGTAEPLVGRMLGSRGHMASCTLATVSSCGFEAKDAAARTASA